MIVKYDAFDAAVYVCSILKNNIVVMLSHAAHPLYGCWQQSERLILLLTGA